MICLCCFFEQKTAYEMRISDWSSDVCSSDLRQREIPGRNAHHRPQRLLRRAEGRPRLRRIIAQEIDRLPHFGNGVGQRLARLPHDQAQPIGRASCRERVCQYVYISVVAVSLNKTAKLPTYIHHITQKT